MITLAAMKMLVPSQELLDHIRARFTYDPITGYLYRDGQKVGYRGEKDYLRIEITPISNVHYTRQVHQVCWYLAYGSWPDKPIDHIDGVRSNNQLNNLRLATHTQNNHNGRKITTRNGKKVSSQYKGVHWLTRSSMWEATFIANGKKQHLGLYATEEAAARAYDDAAYRHDPTHACLNFGANNARERSEASEGSQDRYYLNSL